MSVKKNKIQFFHAHKRIYPKKVWGKYRKLKWLVMGVTLAIYYLAPWIRWDRGPNLPDQAILIDIPKSRAYFFFIEIWPQEVYYITGILILSAVSLFFVTSLFGRVWCGYTCPQTVWTDLFIWVERFFQGDRNERQRRDSKSFSFDKLWRKLLTHLTWLFIALCTAGAWVFYFNDAPTLLTQISNLHVSTSVLGWVAALTFSTYLMAGFAREQVCMYMCPYARFQSAMFDKDSLIIGYDEERGEPRGKHKKGDSWENRGHCIDCKACVQVCPAGIDIRKGLQMECIACGLCIDACNNIMDKIDLPHGLIRYDTIRNQENRALNKTQSFRILRPRTFYYVGIILLTGSVMLYSLLNRANLALHVMHDRNPLFVKLSDGSIRNGYDIKILNKSLEDKTYSLRIAGINSLQTKVRGPGEIKVDSLPVFSDSVGHFKIFITAEKQYEANTKISFVLTDNDTKEKAREKSVFISNK